MTQPNTLLTPDQQYLGVGWDANGNPVQLTQQHQQQTNPLGNPAPQRGTSPLDPSNIESLAPWQESTLALANRSLDPQWQQAEARFNQDMVNRGIAQGSEAYTAARSDFDRGRNDAYGSARNQALAQALAAQNQGFGQDLANRQLLEQAAGRNSRNAGLTSDAAWNRQFAERQFGEDTRRWDLGRGDQLGQQDFQNMGWLMGFDRDSQYFNAGQQQQDFNNQLPFFGLVPNQGPSQIDTYSPYQMNQQAASQNAQTASNQQNGTMGAIGSIAGAALMVF